MIVPNYVPDPLEVSGSVADGPYLGRIRFMRWVVGLYLLSVAAIGGLSYVPIPPISVWTALGGLGAVLLLLELWRILARGKKIEGIVSSFALIGLLPSVAVLMDSLRSEGFPVWQAMAPALCIGAYMTLCGRDFSFVGCYLLSLIVSTVAVAGIATLQDLSQRNVIFALATNLALLTYLVYDLASLLSRRRVGEEVAAVTDLYRDVLNFFGYFVRVVRHWRRHRIWSLPTPER